MEEGTGIGLALSKRLTEAMSGTPTMTSTQGQGSTFTVELPSAEVRSSATSGSRSRPCTCPRS